MSENKDLLKVIDEMLEKLDNDDSEIINQTNTEFNSQLNKLMEFYGSSMSDVLDTKLSFLKNDLDKYINDYESEYKERKQLLNKLSFLVGSLIAIVLI